MTEYTHTTTGLRQRYGLDEVQKARVWEVADGDYGGARAIEVDIYFANLPAFGSSAIPTKFVSIPKGVMIDKVELAINTAYAGATATFSAALVDAADDTSNPIALVTNLAVASMVVGIVAGNGAGIGSTTALRKHVQYSVGTANFTAGKGVLRIYVRAPFDRATDTLGA